MERKATNAAGSTRGITEVKRGVRLNDYLPHALFLTLAIAIVIMSMGMSTVGGSLVYFPGSNLPMPITCGSRLLFGIDCPACGLTRAFIAISHGDFLQAWRFNPASFLVYLFVVFQVPWQTMQLLRIKSGKAAFESDWYYFAPAGIAAALLFQWMVRLVCW
jgi:hypothetical protein